MALGWVERGWGVLKEVGGNQTRVSVDFRVEKSVGIHFSDCYDFLVCPECQFNLKKPDKYEVSRRNKIYMYTYMQYIIL